MSKICGTLIILDVDGSPITHVTNATLNTSRELPDANDKDSAPWADHLDDCGLREWSVDVDGNADWQEDGNVQTLYELFGTSTDIIFGPEASANVNFTGEASLNDLTLEAPNNETATLSGSITGKGELELITTS